MKNPKKRRRTAGIVLGSLFGIAAVGVTIGLPIHFTRNNSALVNPRSLSITVSKIDSDKASFVLNKLDVKNNLNKEILVRVYPKNYKSKAFTKKFIVKSDQITLNFGQDNNNSLTPDTDYVLEVISGNNVILTRHFKTESKKDTTPKQPEDGNKKPEAPEVPKQPEDGKNDGNKKPEAPEVPKQPEPTPPAPTPVPPPSDKPKLNEDEIADKLSKSVVENKEVTQNKIAVTLKLDQEAFDALKAKSDVVIKAKLTEKDKKITDTNSHEETKEVKLGTSKDLDFVFENLKPSKDYTITFMYGDGKKSDFKKHNVKTTVISVEIPNAREPKDAFLTTGSVAREFEYTVENKESKPSWIDNNDKNQDVLASFTFEVELDDEKHTKKEVSSPFPIKIRALYSVDDKTLTLSGYFPLPGSAFDEANKKEIPLKNYKVKMIEIKNKDNKSTAETLSLGSELESNTQLDFQPPKIKDVIKKDNKMYIEFDQSIEGLAFNESFTFAENGGQLPFPFPPPSDFLSDKNYEEKIVSRKGGSSSGQILEISFEKIDKKYTAVRLFKLSIKKQDRIYTYLFTLARHNAGKDQDITIEFNKQNPSGASTDGKITVPKTQPPVVSSNPNDNFEIKLPDAKKLAELIKNYGLGN
ncbi:hypothetical protein [Ureaplasma canigenitalium]|uniref:hypothetical protein n=1 Tax=Ureaplasma canigenitalium TaxID=42092 RepID=UPI0004E1AE72|nr:hypothetical protein [Ureaplasma canigenitalium]